MVRVKRFKIMIASRVCQKVTDNMERKRGERGERGEHRGEKDVLSEALPWRIEGLILPYCSSPSPLGHSHLLSLI